MVLVQCCVLTHFAPTVLSLILVGKLHLVQSSGLALHTVIHAVALDQENTLLYVQLQQTNVYQQSSSYMNLLVAQRFALPFTGLFLIKRCFTVVFLHGILLSVMPFILLPSVTISAIANKHYVHIFF